MGARLWANSSGQPGRRLSWFNDQGGIYPGVYARTGSQTRSSRRLHDGLVQASNYGLDTDNDDANMSIYASPYYINGRFMGERTKVQRANISSRYGMERRLSPDEQVVDFEESDILTWLKLKQGEIWRFVLDCENKMVIGNTMTIRNTGAARGYLLISFAISKDAEPLYETFVALEGLTSEKVHKTLYDANTIKPTDGKLYVRVQIYDDINDEYLDLNDEDNAGWWPDTTEPFKSDRYIEIAAAGLVNRDAATYELPNVNERLQEVAYDYHRTPSAPLIGLIYSEWEPVPVNKVGNESNGATVYREGKRYDIFAGNNGIVAKIFIYDYDANEFVDTDIPIDLTTTNVYIAQILDGVYFTDQVNFLRKMVISFWVPSIVTADDSDSGTPLAAPKGPGLLCLHNNRLYLANFPDDPNLAMTSQIEQDGPHYNEFPYRWYVPNKHAKETSHMPITAIMPYTNTSIIFATTQTTDLFTASNSYETGVPTQQDFYGSNFGVAAQGDIFNLDGTVYAWNSTGGIRRYNGANWQAVPCTVDRLLRRVDINKPRCLFGYAKKLYFSYTDEVENETKVIVHDLGMNYQQYPWFQDTNVSFADVRPDNDFLLLSTHSKYLCVENIYKTNKFSDFDTPIVLERHSKYFQVPGLDNDMTLRRLFLAVLGDSTRSWFIGLSLDTGQTMTNEDSRNNVYVWRKVVHQSQQLDDNPEDIFNNEDAEFSGIKRLPINLSARCVAYQTRVKTFTFDSQANMMYVVPEIQPIALL